MQGLNGALAVEGDMVTISRGLRGIVLSRGASKIRRLSLGEVKGVWYCAGRGKRMPGYVHVVTAGPGPASNDYLACMRDASSVTFVGEPETWLALASRVAALSGVVLEEFPAPAAGSMVRKLAGARRDDHPRF